MPWARFGALSGCPMTPSCSAPSRGSGGRPATGGRRELLTTVDAEKQEAWHLVPKILPDGETLLFGVYSGSAAPARIEALSLRTGERTALVEGSARAQFLPPGYLVYSQNDEAGFTTGLVWAVPFDPDRLEVRAEPVALESVSVAQNAPQFTLADDGTLLYIPGAARFLGSRRLV